MKKTIIATLLATTALLASATQAASIDLSNWIAEGDGNWQMQDGNDTVLQTINGQPTVFFNNQNSQGQALSGNITVTSATDDDYIGFVLGYNAGDLNNTNADYLLIDWKQADQSYKWGNATTGLSVSRVTGSLNAYAAWPHDEARHVQELQRSTNFGSTGWQDNTSYSFDLVFTDSLVQVFVNDNLELSINGTFADGSFGFYNFSQPNVLYSGITKDTAEAFASVPAPATLGITLLGLCGLLARRVSKK